MQNNRMNNTNQHLEYLISQLQGVGLNLPLSKFIKINFEVITEIKKLCIPLNTQVQIVQKCIGKSVSNASLSVAFSRASPNKNKKNSHIIIMEKPIIERFVDKGVILTLGTQKEKNPGKKDSLIDWRGLADKESVSSWVLEYKDQLIAINKTGWRWKQIARAISEHLEKKISTNTLTSIICLANKKEIN